MRRTHPYPHTIRPPGLLRAFTDGKQWRPDKGRIQIAFAPAVRHINGFDRSGHFSVSVSPTALPGLQANACSLCAIMAIDNNSNNNNSFFFLLFKSVLLDLFVAEYHMTILRSIRSKSKLKKRIQLTIN